MAKLPAHPTPPATPPPAVDAAPRASVRTAWWLFGPPIAVAAMHFVLRTLAEAWPPLHALTPVKVADGLGAPDTTQALWQDIGWPLLGLAVGVMIVALSRRYLRQRGATAFRRLALPLWAGACGVAALGLLTAHLNLALREPLPDVEATVLRARLAMPSQRGPGGLQLVLLWPGIDAPRRGLLEGAHARTLLPGRTVTVQRVGGAFWGEYLAGIAELPAPASAPAEVAQAR
jgi:hypothetical protein